MSASLAAVLARRNVHYGWVVAAVTFLTMLVTAGRGGRARRRVHPAAAKGIRLADLGHLRRRLAIRLLLFGLMGPFAAALMNKYGVRRIALTALVADRHGPHRFRSA